MIRGAILVIALLTLTACHPDREIPDDNSASVSPNLRIEVYSTGEAPVTEVERHLMALYPSGNYRELPNGRIAVAAPLSQQASIAKLIDQLTSTRSEPPTEIRLRQWLVEATPADSPMIPENLVSIKDALTDTTALTGPMSFNRLEQVEFRVIEGRKGRIGGKILDVSAGVRQIVSDTILLNMNVNSRSTRIFLETDMAIDSGEHVVMGMVEHPDHEAILLLVLEAEIL